MLLAAGITIVLNSQKKKPKKETASGKKGKAVAIPNAPSLTRIPLPPLWVLDPSSTHSLTHSHTHSLTHSLSLSLSRFLSGEIVSKLQSFKHSKMLPSVYPCAPLCYHQYVSTHYWTQVLGMLSWRSSGCIVFDQKRKLFKLPYQNNKFCVSVTDMSVRVYLFHRLNSVSISDDSSILAGSFSDSIVRVWALTPRKLYSMKSPSQLQHMALSAGEWVSEWVSDSSTLYSTDWYQYTEDVTERILDVRVNWKILVVEKFSSWGSKHLKVALNFLLLWV